MAYVLQDPSDVLDWTFDHATFLDDGGSPSDTISTSSWSVSPSSGSPATPTVASASNTATTATVFVSGLERGGIYQVANTIVTLGGRTLQRSITVRCEDK